MKLCIKNIAKIKSGYSFRSKIPADPQSNIGLIQLRNLSADYEQIDYESLTRIDEGEIPAKHLLTGQEVLFVSKGSKNKAVSLRGFVNLRLAASATFFILVPDLEKISPEFLAWSLNQPTAQSYFDSIRSGTSTQNINKQALADLFIEVPELEKQQHVFEINNLFIKEKELAEKLLDKRQILITTILNTYLNE